MLHHLTVDRQLIGALAKELGTTTKVEGDVLRAVVQQGDAWLATRIRTEPVAEVFVITRPLDGFELAIRWGDRWRDPDVGDVAFDTAFGLTTNDEPLMRAWLDDTSRAALLASAYASQADDTAYDHVIDQVTGRTAVMHAWSYELGNDQLAATKGSRERRPDRYMTAIKTACTVAARSQRWAAEYAEVARQLGGTAAPEVEIGGGPIMSITRSAIDVTVRMLRRNGRGDDRLRTVISAPRVGDGRLGLWNDHWSKGDLPKNVDDGEKFPLELGEYRLRASSKEAAAKIDDLAKKLLAVAQPVAVVVDADSVDLWFEGALAAFDRLDTAVALAAKLAVDAIAPQGPYR